MNLSIKVPASLNRFLGSLGPAGRHQLFSVAANALQILVRNHIVREVPRHHVAASRLGATPTGFLEKAARKTVFRSTTDRAEVKSGKVKAINPFDTRKEAGDRPHDERAGEVQRVA